MFKNRAFPEGTRVFEQTAVPHGYWVYGPGTENHSGDYYSEYDGVTLIAAAIYSLDMILLHKEAREVSLDTDFSVDVGL